LSPEESEPPPWEARISSELPQGSAERLPVCDDEDGARSVEDRITLASARSTADTEACGDELKLSFSNDIVASSEHALGEPWHLPPEKAQPKPLDLLPTETPSAAGSLPLGFLGTPVLPTLGSAEHCSGRCKPCAFVYKGGCASGLECKFCHLCQLGEKKRRKKERKEQRRVFDPCPSL
ncbi:unnamed protein product, partial [Polarella glacialis]